MPSEIEMPICEICNKNQATGVCCVPGVPISCAYCKECLDANAHPWWVLLANTVCLGGLEHAAYWWKKMVEDTCLHLGRTKEEFNQEVQKEIDGMDKVEKEILHGKEIPEA